MIRTCIRCRELIIQEAHILIPSTGFLESTLMHDTHMQLEYAKLATFPNGKSSHSIL